MSLQCGTRILRCPCWYHYQRFSSTSCGTVQTLWNINSDISITYRKWLQVPLIIQPYHNMLIRIWQYSSILQGSRTYRDVFEWTNMSELLWTKWLCISVCGSTLWAVSCFVLNHNHVEYNCCLRACRPGQWRNFATGIFRIDLMFLKNPIITKKYGCVYVMYLSVHSRQMSLKKAIIWS